MLASGLAVCVHVRTGVCALGESEACYKGLTKIDCRFKTFPECLNVYLKKTIPVSNLTK